MGFLTTWELLVVAAGEWGGTGKAKIPLSVFYHKLKKLLWICNLLLERVEGELGSIWEVLTISRVTLRCRNLGYWENKYEATANQQMDFKHIFL